jgi:LPXTG-motif cell wall-anchored protein
VEALVIAGVGVGTRSRLLVLAGSSFVGLAALRGAVLAVDSGVPVALVIGLIALALIGGATWLSLRRRSEPGTLG